MCDAGGWIKTYRKLTKWQWYDSPFTAKIFIHCILVANYKDGFWRGLTIPRGSFVTSFEKLAMENGMSVQQTRTAINNLISTGEIIKQSTSKYTIISILNYDTYQTIENAEQQTINKQSTNNQQTNNKQITTNKNIKNNENGENIENQENDIMSDNSDVASPIVEIIDYLNLKIKSNYKHTTPKIKQLINARLKEKFTIEDFKSVIDKKTKEWIDDPKFSAYLRPETLFGTKFESYLNQKEIIPNAANQQQPSNRNSRNDRLTIKQLEESFERSKATIYADAAKCSPNYRAGNVRNETEPFDGFSD